MNTDVADRDLLMWDRTFASPPDAEQHEVPDELHEALSKLWEQQQRGDFALDKLKLVRQLRRPDGRQYESSYTLAATYTVGPSWSALELGAHLVGAARAAAPDDKDRATPKWGAKFIARGESGNTIRPTPGSAYFDLNDLDQRDPTSRMPGPSEERDGLIAYYQNELGRHHERLHDERRQWQALIRQEQERASTQFAEQRSHYEKQVAELGKRHEEALAAERTRADAEIRDKTMLIVENAKALVEICTHALGDVREQNKELHERVANNNDQLRALADRVLDPSQNVTVQAVSMLATSAELMKTTLADKDKALDERAKAEAKKDRADFMRKGLDEAAKLGRMWMRVQAKKAGVELPEDDKEVNAKKLRRAVETLVEGASDDDWSEATKLVGAQLITQIRELADKWDDKRARELVERLLVELADAGEDQASKFSPTTQRNLIALLEAFDEEDES